MKNPFLPIVCAIALLGGARAFAHGEHEFGPAGGRIVELSTNETLHGEVTLKDGKFHVALLDHDKKPIELKDQTLRVTGGDRTAPETPNVEKVDNHFVFSALKGNRYLMVLQFKESADAKTINARLTYDAAICSGCKKAEWLCSCTDE